MGGWQVGGGVGGETGGAHETAHHLTPPGVPPSTQIPFPSVYLSPLFKRPPCMMGACAGVR